MALPVLITPVLTRLYGPEDFGSLAVFAAFLSLSIAFSTWRFDWLIPNARTRASAASLFLVGLLCLVIACLVITGLLSLGAFNWSSVGSLGALAFLLPVALFAGGVRSLLSGWFVRKGDLKHVGKATIAQAGANAAASLALGMVTPGAFGLLMASTLAAWSGIGTLLRHSWSGLRSSLAKVDVPLMGMTVARHGRNATWSTLVSVINAASLTAPVLVLSYFYSSKEVGWYSLMFRLLAAPIGALSSALGQSFWSRAAELARARRVADLSALYQKTTFRLGLAALPVVGVCMIGPYVVGPILGSKEWEEAGYILRAMMPLFVGTIMFSPTNHLVVLNRQVLQVLVDCIRLVLVVVSISLASFLGLSFIAAVGLTSVSSFIGHAALFLSHKKVHWEYGRS